MDDQNYDKINPIRASRSFVWFQKEEIEQSISERFEKIVIQYPNTVAVNFQNIEITYEELNRFSNLVAHSILSLYGTEQGPIAFIIENKYTAIGGILGILKSRKLFVAIDPSLPDPSIRSILEEAQIKLILTCNKNFRLSSKLSEPGELQVLNLDTLKGSDLSSDNPKVPISPNDLAYIYYTSGSTGKPKGVVDNHRNVLHNIMRYTNTLKIAPEDRLTLLQSFSFSGSVSSLFCALLNGATSFPFSLIEKGAKRMAFWINDNKISIYHSVPSIFRLIATGERHFPSLRIIRLEGDQAGVNDIVAYKKYFSDSCILVNGLGATECGLVRQYFVDKSTPNPQATVPIGFDVPDMRVSLQDETGREVDPEAVGEITIESEYLARGYWRRPDLTKAVFVQSSRSAAGRIYHTGDLGRFRPDGCLEYLGRKDFYRKIRGHWVDLGIVEKIISNLGAFKEVEVTFVDEPESKSILVAYLVPDESPTLEINTIRLYLSEHLPAHMIPSSYVFLESLPVNSDGKIDRRALPPPTQERPNLSVPLILPENELQKMIQKIWQEELRTYPIGIEDVFFNIGGDSLHALAVLSEIEKETDRIIPPEALFANPTIKSLADYLQYMGKDKEPPLVEIQKGNLKKTFYFLHGDYLDGGFYSRRIAQYLQPDQPFCVLPPCGSNGYPILGSYQEMATIHIQEMRKHQPKGPYMLGGTCNGGLVAYEMARQLNAIGEIVNLLILINSSASNIRFRWLRRFLYQLCHFLPNGAKIESGVFGLIHLVLKKLSEFTLFQLPEFLWANKERILEEMSSILARFRKVGSANKEIMNYSEQGRKLNADETISRYHRIDREYMPSNYSGIVTVIWPKEQSECPEAAESYWRNIAKDVDFYLLPGTQTTKSLGIHAKQIAKILMSCIEAEELEQ